MHSIGVACDMHAVAYDMAHIYNIIGIGISTDTGIARDGEIRSQIS